MLTTTAASVVRGNDSSGSANSNSPKLFLEPVPNEAERVEVIEEVFLFPVQASFIAASLIGRNECTMRIFPLVHFRMNTQTVVRLFAL